MPPIPDKGVPRSKKTLDQDRVAPKLDWERRVGPDPRDPRCDSCQYVTLALEEWLILQQRCLNCPIILTDPSLQLSCCDFCLGPLCLRCEEWLDGICVPCRGARSVEKLESRLPARDRAAGSTEAATSASASPAPPTLPQGPEANSQILHSEEEQDA